MEMTQRGSGIWSYTFLKAGAILFVRVPATIITSAWRWKGRRRVGRGGEVGGKRRGGGGEEEGRWVGREGRCQVKTVEYKQTQQAAVKQEYGEEEE